MGSVARSIIDAVAVHGATTVFGLPGVHNLAFWKVPEGAPLVVRHEQAAVYAADGWARATGRLGAAVVTTGPGAANALAAFGEAAAARSPVLLVASEIPQSLRRAGRLRGVLHESRDQAGLFRPLAKAVFTPRSAAEVAGMLGRSRRRGDAAPARARLHGRPRRRARPRGRRADGPTSGAASPFARGSAHWFEPPPTDADLDAAAAVLADARVVIWAGGGAVDAEPSLAVLAEHLGAPVVASYGGRGVPPTAHPCAVGLPPHEPEVAELIARADVLLAVGGDLDGMNTRNWTMPRPPRLVTLDPAPPGRPAGVGGRRGGHRAGRRGAARPARPPPDPRAVGPAGSRRSGRGPGSPPTRRARRRWRSSPPSRPRGRTRPCWCATWPSRATGSAGTRAPPARGRLAYPVGWGTLGFGLPAAIGPAAAGHPVIAVCGDGGLAMALGELATLVQERLPVTVLVVDDGGYGMLRYDQARVGDPEVGVDLVGPDFFAVAAAFGMPATGVSSVRDGLAAALAKAVGSGGPHLVHVPARLVPPRTTSPRWHED